MCGDSGTTCSDTVKLERCCQSRSGYCSNSEEGDFVCPYGYIPRKNSDTIKVCNDDRSLCPVNQKVSNCCYKLVCSENEEEYREEDINCASIGDDWDILPLEVRPNLLNVDLDNRIYDCCDGPDDQQVQQDTFSVPVPRTSAPDVGGFSNMELHEGFQNKNNSNIMDRMSMDIIEGYENEDEDDGGINVEENCDLIKKDLIEALGIVPEQLKYDCELNDDETEFIINTTIYPTEDNPITDNIKEKISSGIELKSLGVTTSKPIQPERVWLGGGKGIGDTPPIMIIVIIAIILTTIGGAAVFLR